MKKFILTGFLCLMAITAYAQRVGTAVITLGLPTTATDNSPLSGTYALTSVELFISQGPIPDTAFTRPSVILYPENGVMPTKHNYPGVQPGVTIYVRAKACNINGCSSLGKQMAVTNNSGNSQAVPNSPAVGVTITY